MSLPVLNKLHGELTREIVQKCGMPVAKSETGNDVMEKCGVLKALIFAAIIFGCFHSPVTAQQQVPVSCKGPLTEEQVVRLLTSGVADRRVQQFVSECTVDFEVSEEVEGRLQKAGASQDVLRLARLSPSPKQSKLLLLKVGLRNAINLGDWTEAKRKLEALRTFGVTYEELRPWSAAIEEHERVERQKQEETAEEKRREEVRLAELRRKLGIELFAVVESTSDPTLDEARQELASLQARIRDIEARLKVEYPGLQETPKIPPKGPFEPTAEYEVRKARAIAEHGQVEQAYNKDLVALTETHNKQVADLLSRKYRQPGLKLTLTKYDADQRLLFATVGDNAYWFEVEPDKARVFYTHQNSLDMKGNFLKTEDDRRPMATEITLLDSQTHEELKSAGVGPNYASGFTAMGMSLNGAARLVGTRLRLTDAARTGFAGASAFWNTLLDVQKFTTDFRFQMQSRRGAYGFTFVIQNVRATALGPGGVCLGYGADYFGKPAADSIRNSLAVEFRFVDYYQVIGLSRNGESSPGRRVVPIESSDVDLSNGDAYNLHFGYDGTTLTLTITDTARPTVTFSANWAVDIPNVVGSKTAYVGFTGGSGLGKATQEVINWSYTPGPP